MAYTRGDILETQEPELNRDRAYHPIIFWESIHNSDDFIGLMITHSKSYKNINNYLMNETHFNPLGEIVFNESHLVKAKFTKYHNWGPFVVKGNLTPEGIQFVNYIIEDCPVQSFSEYKNFIDRNY